MPPLQKTLEHNRFRQLLLQAVLRALDTLRKSASASGGKVAKFVASQIKSAKRTKRPALRFTQPTDGSDAGGTLELVQTGARSYDDSCICSSPEPPGRGAPPVLSGDEGDDASTDISLTGVRRTDPRALCGVGI